MEQTAVVLASLFVDALQFIPDHASLLLQKAAETAELAFTALGIAILIAMPIGLWLGHRHRGLLLALGASSVGRALPSIALIGIFIAWLGVHPHIGDEFHGHRAIQFLVACGENLTHPALTESLGDAVLPDLFVEHERRW